MESPLQLVIGIDGGATYSHGVAATHDGRVLAVVHSASMNFTGSYQKEVRRRVGEILRDLELRLPFDNEFTHYAVSAAGIFNESTADQKEKLCGKIYPWKRTRLVGDSIAAFQGATLGRPGALAICGTGTSIIACNEDEEVTQLGGWGPLLEDVGSAYWIAVRCICAAIAEFEQTGPKTLITEALCEWHEIKNVQGLVPLVYHPEFTRDKFAILASRLDREIGTSDPIYRKICREAGEAVGNLTIQAVEKSGLNTSPLPLFFSGGVLQFNREAMKSFEATVRRAFKIMLSHPRLPTVLGAVMLALREAKVEITDTLVTQLETTYKNIDELVSD
jgi:N-acetylglucosamine kinase-like BadF-type ATPase